ncbi:MAG: hypothetical protein WDN46_24310 [Methylocella sp.]
MQKTELKQRDDAVPGAASSAEGEANATPTAAYIAQMANELARLARFTRLDLLTHLLDMARLEAEICVESASECASLADAAMRAHRDRGSAAS